MRVADAMFFGGTAVAAASAPPKATWISSTQEAPWTQSVIDGGDPGALPSRLTITDDRYQSMTGFGACFNELGWDALQTVSEADRQGVLKKLFAPGELGLTYNRVPIGASDYADGWYSHNEMQGDLEQSNFTVGRDEQHLIPYIRAAQQYMQQGSDPQFLFASAWSPPQWMKQNDQCSNCDGEQGQKQHGLVKTDEVQSSYALYLSKFVAAYGERGINVTSVMVQNEPYADGCGYPKCSWTGAEMRDFIKGYFGPLFAKEHGPDSRFPSEVWLGTLNTDNFEESAQTVYSDKHAAQYVQGMAFQWAGASIIGAAHKQWPGLNMIQSENECGNGQNDWDYALDHIFERYHAFITNGARAYVYWNPILDGPSHGLSHWGWKQNSMISVWNSSVVFNPEYYLMKHFSRFVRPGAVRVGVAGKDWSKDGWAMAFASEDEISVVLANDRKTTRNLTLVASGVAYTAQLPPRSFHTFVLPTTTPCADGFAPLAGDCPGFNLKQVSGGSAESCKGLCAKNPSCAGFSFNADDEGSSECYMKSRKCDVVTPSEDSHGYYFWDKCADIAIV